jgi:predicted metal-dependent hydrolase
MSVKKLSQLVFGFVRDLTTKPRRADPAGWIELRPGQRLRVHFLRNPRAMRYILKLDRNGEVKVTIPRRGSFQDAREFLSSRRSWIEAQHQRMRGQNTARRRARAQGLVYFRGEEVVIGLEATRPASLRLGGERFPLGMRRAAQDLVPTARELRDRAEEAMRKLAASELPARAWHWARQHGITRLKRVSVRGQRSRWGSCSVRGHVSLNWRLVQTPPFVRDYVILHELMHLRELNHSERFWRQVADVCPRWEEAEIWLKGHGDLLLE